MNKKRLRPPGIRISVSKKKSNGSVTIVTKRVSPKDVPPSAKTGCCRRKNR